MSASERALSYATRVVEKDITAGRFVILACQRFLDDLEKSITPEYPYEFNAPNADRVVRFMERMPHVKGKWAAKKELMVMQDWQCFVECNLFGWRHKETRLRRFRTAYEEAPRKNGKSSRVAARGLYMFCADGEAGSEVYSGATTEKQAHEVFRPAWNMVKRTPVLRSKLGIEQFGSPTKPGTIYTDRDMSKFEAIVGKPGDGASPHCAIIDEYHEHQTDHMVDTMQTGMGSREQPLLSIITTAGNNLSGPCYQMRQDLIRVLEGQIQDETLFGIIYGIDDGDEWDTEEALIKANPNYGVSVFGDFLLSQLAQAKRSASKQNAYKTKHLNMWVGARTAWMDMLAWQRQKAQFEIEDFLGCPCWIACDLATKKDVTAVVMLFRKEGHYYVIPQFFVPESAVYDSDKYKTFMTSGEIIVTPGNTTDQEFIEEAILEMAAQVELEDISFDDWQANYIMTRLISQGLPVINYGQTVKNMSEPMKEVEARVLNKTLWHNGNKALTWMMGNVAARIDAKENIYPRKGNEDDPNCKIDGVVALIMAMGRAQTGDETDISDFLSAPVMG